MKMNKHLLSFTAIAAIGIAIVTFFDLNRDNTARAGIDITNQKQVALGKTLYAQQCAVCHGKNLEGQTPNWRQPLPDGTFPAPPHDATGHTWHHPDKMLFDITKFSRSGGSKNLPPTTMPAFKDKLTDSEIWAVLSYIKSQWPLEIQQRHDTLNKHHHMSK